MQVQTLYKYIEQKGDLASLAPLLTSLTKQKTAVTQLVKQGHKDLEELTALLQRLGVKLQVGDASKPLVEFDRRLGLHVCKDVGAVQGCKIAT